jgi:hypothetical protein
MMHDNEVAKDIGKAVVIAALGTAATKLVEWAVEELRQKVRDVRKPSDSSASASSEEK